MIETRYISATVLMGVLRLSDLLIIAVAGLLSFYLRFDTLALDTHSTLLVVVVSVVAADIFRRYRLYDTPAVLAEPFRVKKMFLALVTVTFIVLTIGYITKTSQDFSRVWLALWGLFAILFLLLSRAYLSLKLARWQAKGWLTRRIALVGAGAHGQRFVEHFAKTPDPRISIVGVFDDRHSRVPAQIGEYTVQGTVDELLASIAESRIDEVVVALPWTAESRLVEIMGKLRSAPVDVRLCPEGVAYQFTDRAYTDTRGVGMLNIYDRPMSSWSSVIKRIEDRVLAVIILIFIMPLMAAIAVAIKLDSRGPVLFKQRRYGFSNMFIGVYKFRTLFHDLSDQDDEKQVTKNDKRVTRVGAFLRRSKLDELPQFFNVLGGSMSIVGPRPHATRSKAGGKLFEEVVSEYFARHRVKPGITGWAQVNGYHGETSTKEEIERRVEFDLYYIEKWSLWLDLKIILMTPFAVLFSKNG